MRRERLETLFDKQLVLGKTVVAAVSGGADSMAMLHMLCEMQKNGEIAGLTVAHLNHLLRGESSDRDEALVRNYCMKQGIAFVRKRENVTAFAETQKLTLEEAGRELRYAFFRQVAENLPKPTVIATAHTLSDHLETGLLHLTRGSGLMGLCGIPKKRGMIVRPMLQVTRAAVEDYCERMGLVTATDETNSDPRYARNRVRKQVVPALKVINPAVEQSYGRLTESLSEDADLLCQLANALYLRARTEHALRIDVLQEAHPALQSRVCARFLQENDFSADYRTVTQAKLLIQKGHGKTNLTGGCQLAAIRGKLTIRRPLEEKSLSALTFFVDPEWEANVLWNGQEYVLQVVSRKEWETAQKIYKNLLFLAIDYDTIIGKLTLRGRLAGDTFASAVRNVSKPVRRWFDEAGLSPEKRASASVLADENGVLWLEGFGPDRRAQIGTQTSRVLWMIRQERTENEHDGTIYRESTPQ